MSHRLKYFIALLFLLYNCAAEVIDGKEDYMFSDNYINSEEFWPSEPEEPENSAAVDTEANDAAVEGGDSSRLDVGLAGIASAAGLQKGASLLGLILLPLLAPILTIAGLVLFGIFLFFSISATTGGPVVGIGKRQMPDNMVYDNIYKPDSSYTLTQNVLASNECIERITCEIMKRVNNQSAKNIIIGLIDIFNIKVGLKRRITLAASRHDDCEIYFCHLKKFMNSVKLLKASS